LHHVERKRVGCAVDPQKIGGNCARHAERHVSSRLCSSHAPCTSMQAPTRTSSLNQAHSCPEELFSSMSSPTMSTDSPPSNPLAESGVTIPSDSEQYSASASPPTSSNDASNSPPLVLYQPPTIWSLIRGAAINLILPFVNGMMLGFGELFAHEAAFRLGWSGTKVRRALEERGP
jgi:hypothetical protein